MTRTKGTYLALLVVLLSPMAANADVITISGEVTGATSVFAALLPPPQPVDGQMDVDNAAILEGLAGAGDINSIDINVGGFCFSTGPDSTDCLFGGAHVPIISIDFAALTFNLGDVGGTLALTSFSPSFGVYIPVFFDFNDGIFFTIPNELGDVEGVIAGTYVFTPVPEPGTLALLGLGLVGMAARRRKTV